MTTSTLQELLRGINPQYVVAFFMVLARISPLFLVAPAFSSQMLIPRVRSVLAVGIAFSLTPMVLHGQTMPMSILPMALLMLQNFLVGFAFAFALSCVFAAVQGAGTLADSLSGFSFGQTVDPINGNPGGALTNLYTVVGLAMFLAIGGDAWTLRGLDATFQAIPIGEAALTKPLVGLAEASVGSIFVGAIEIAAPLILALIVSDIAFGMVSRVVPQLNVFAVGFPIKIGVALLVVAVSLPFLGTWFTDQLQTSVFAAIHALKVA
jgi:flagellar biosynthesis protein FliR